MKAQAMKVIGLVMVLGAATAAAANSVSSAVAVNPPLVMDVSGGVIVGGGDALPGVDLQVAGNLRATEFPLYIGGELGLFFVTGRYNSEAVIPILGKAYTVFHLTPRAHFRLGASLGPVIATSGGYSGSGLAFLIDPAFLFGLGSGIDMTLQARFGAMGGTFVTVPELGLTFAI